MNAEREPRFGRKGIAAAVMLAILPPAAVGGGLLLAPLQAIAGVFAAPAPPRWAALRIFLVATAPLLAFAAWAAASSLWSPVDRPEQAAKILGAVVTGLLLVAGIATGNDRDRALARAALVSAVIVLICLSAIEAGMDMPINRIDEPTTDPGILERNPGKGVSILVAIVWGAIGALIDGRLSQRLLWRVLLVLTAVLSLQFHMATNTVGFVFGLAAFTLGWSAPRVIPVVVSVGLAIWLLIAPWASTTLMSTGVADSLPMSWRMRGEIWKFATARIEERLLTGWGLDGARKFGDVRGHIGDLEFKILPLHPHSMSIHVWLETGLVGASLLACAIVAAGLTISKTLGHDRAAAASAAAAMAAVGVIWNVSYGAWQEWWMATAFIAAASAAAVHKRSTRDA